METKSNLTKTLLASLFIAILGLGSLWILRPFIPSLIWAAMIAVATWPLLTGLERRLGGKRALAVTAMLVAMVILVIGPVGVSAYVLLSHADDAIAWLKNVPNYTLPPPPAALAKFPVLGSKISTEWQHISSQGPGGLSPYLQTYSGNIMNWIATGAKNTGLFFLHLVLTIILTGIFFARGEIAALGVRRFFFRVAGERGDTAVILAGQSVKAVAMGIIVTALIQTALGGLGIYAAGVPFVTLLTAGMFIFCIAQLGPAIPMLIGVAWLFNKDFKTAASLLLVWTVAVGLLDNFLRPVLIKKGADLPLLLILAGVLGGLAGFGIVGLFIGPVLLAVTYRLLQAWVQEDDEKTFTTPINFQTPPERSSDIPLDH